GASTPARCPWCPAVAAAVPPFRHFVALATGPAGAGVPNKIKERRMTAVDATRNRPLEQLDAAARRRRRIEAFHPWGRRYVAQLPCCSAELEDLADTFPALLFALVSGYGTPQMRERAFELVSAGASLREAADAIGLA